MRTAICSMWCGSSTRRRMPVRTSIRVYVQREKNFHSGQNELLYLTIHIARVMEHPDEK